MLDFMQEATVVDTGFLGSYFTWCNNRCGRAQIWKRVDRMLINSVCMASVSSIAVSHLVREPSDHAFLLLSFSTRLDTLPRPFRFLNIWTSKDGLFDVIKDAWQIEVVRSPFYVVRSKLRGATRAIQKWNKENFGDIFVNVKKA